MLKYWQELHDFLAKCKQIMNTNISKNGISTLVMFEDELRIASSIVAGKLDYYCYLLATVCNVTTIDVTRNLQCNTY